jgi:hypothetical protein
MSQLIRIYTVYFLVRNNRKNQKAKSVDPESDSTMYQLIRIYSNRPWNNPYPMEKKVKPSPEIIADSNRLHNNK